MNETDKRRIIDEAAEFIKRCCGSELTNELVDDAAKRNNIYRLKVCLANIAAMVRDISNKLIAVQNDEEKTQGQQGDNEARQEVGKADLQPDRE